MPSKHEFIKQLQGDLTPVKPLASPLRRSLLWSISTLVVLIVLFVTIGPIRPGALGALGFNRFTVETVAGFLGLFFAAQVLFKMNVPGLKVPTWQVLLGFAPMLVFAGFLAYGHFVESAIPASMVGKRSHCVHEVFFLSFLPLGYMWYQLRKGYSLFEWKQFLLVGLAATTVPVMVMQFVCMYHPMHNLMFHVGPGLVLSGLVVAAGSWWIRR